MPITCTDKVSASFVNIKHVQIKLFFLPYQLHTCNRTKHSKRILNPFFTMYHIIKLRSNVCCFISLMYLHLISLMLNISCIHYLNIDLLMTSIHNNLVKPNSPVFYKFFFFFGGWCDFQGNDHYKIKKSKHFSANMSQKYFCKPLLFHHFVKL